MYFTVANVMEIPREMTESFKESICRLDVLSVLGHSLASLSLTNASIISLRLGEESIGERQFAFAFVLYVTAVSANGGDVIHFWQLIGCASICVAGLLQLPGIERTEMQRNIVLSSSIVGSIAITVAAMTNYFHFFVHHDLEAGAQSKALQENLSRKRPAFRLSFIGLLSRALLSRRGTEDHEAQPCHVHSSSIISETDSDHSWSSNSDSQRSHAQLHV